MKLIGRLLTALIAVAVTATALYALVPTVRAAPPQPHNVYGLAAPGVGLGALITGWVDGVDYSNDTLTYTVGGAYDLDVYGNWYTNLSNPNTITVKEGADQNDSVMLVQGDMTAVGTGTVFQQTFLWRTGNSDNVDIAPAAAGNQPALLKIDCMNLRPSDAGTQYVWVHNPTGATVDFSNYYVKKDGVGAKAYNAWQTPLTGMIAAGTSEYFSLGSGTRLNATGDDLELVWNNAPGSAFGGNDVVVDRVEFNGSTSGTHYWEASNTLIMTDASLSAAGRVLERTPTPATDTNTGGDFTETSEATCNRPGAILISITSPAGGESWSGNSAHNVMFTITAGGNVNWWGNYSTDGLSWTNFDLSAGSVPPGAFTRSWTVPCIDSTTVRVRIEATQGASTGGATSNLFEIDCTAPVPTLNPLDAANNVPTSTLATLDFNEDMNTGALVQADVVFTPAVARSGNPTWTGLQVLNVNNLAFAQGTLYNWYVSCNVKDDSDPGNPVAGCGANLWTFTTSADPAPVVTITAPAGGERWSGSSNHGLAWTMTDNDADPLLAVRVNYTSGAGNGVVTGPTTGIEVFTWMTPCITDSNVHILVDVTDTANQKTVATSNAFAIDCTAPTATPNPTNAQTGVAVNAAMTVTFSEPMNPAAGNGDVTISGGITPTGVVYGTSTRLDVGSHPAFATSTLYNWFISCNLVDDSDPGNPVAGCGANMWTFTTSASSNQLPTAAPIFVEAVNTAPAITHIIDTVSPTFSWTYADGDGGVQSNWAWYLNVSGGANVDLNTGASAAASDTYVGAALSRGTTYELRVFVRDGTDWSSAATLLFTVNSLPTAPVLLLPANAATGVAAGSTTLDWQDSTDPDTDPIVSYEYCMRINLDPLPCSDGTGTPTVSTATATTSPGTQYHWMVRANDGWEDGPYSTVFVFTTGANTPPSIAITSPVSGNSWTGATSHTISWTITDENAATVMIYANYTSSDGNGVITSGAGLSSFPWNTPAIDAVNVVVTVDAVDAQGAKASPLASSAAFEIDSTPPVISASTPTRGATGFNLAAAIVLTFSEPMDATATQGAVTLTPNPGAITFTWSGGNTVLSIGHATLAASTAYTVTVSSSAKDDSDTGNTMVPDTISFTSGDSTNPSASITPPGAVESGKPATFGCTCTDDSGGTLNYTWEARQGNSLIATGYGNTFTVTFPNSGPYTVSLTLRDPSGNPDSDVVSGSVQQPVEGVTPWWLIILIVLIVVGLLLFLLVAKRRKKPAEDEAVPPPPGAAAPPPPPPGGAPPPPPSAEGATHECPSCGTIVTAGDTECFMCGTKL